MACVFERRFENSSWEEKDDDHRPFEKNCKDRMRTIRMEEGMLVGDVGGKGGRIWNGSIDTNHVSSGIRQILNCAAFFARLWIYDHCDYCQIFSKIVTL